MMVIIDNNTQYIIHTEKRNNVDHHVMHTPT